MASLNEAFVFPLTATIINDKEVTKTNVAGRGSYVPLKTETYKAPKVSNTTSDLKMYNQISLKE